ncbi:hypothetical protein QR97_02260 [Streptomyces sp. PBH53]|uniref:hypothetical protein n=1 Tax=Streptomyces sp. PBH53 TaxID=1577075 RepID=UPI00065510B3|nr:hypothetical protein [Streptomyces sp. PBH53]AKN68781.1 hypothetical protein QR97_02260 [Streptomyces sp. PBH53]
MSTRDVDLVPALAGGISDRAFRLYTYLVLYSGGDWVSVEDLAHFCNLTNHQAREPLTELRHAGMAESKREYVMGEHGRKTWRTSYRLVQDAVSRAAA